MKSGWQDRFRSLLCDAVEIIDPRSHDLSDPAAYTAWDLDGVRRADILVVYMGPHNPSGFGLSLEAGYGHALGKPIIFVDEMQQDWRGRYFDMLRVISKVVPSLQAAADAVHEFMAAA